MHPKIFETASHFGVLYNVPTIGVSNFPKELEHDIYQRFQSINHVELLANGKIYGEALVPTCSDARNFGHPKVFFDITINGKSAGRIVMVLYANVVPKTVENFIAYCTGKKGISKSSGKPLHFKGTCFHKVIPGKMAVAGDVTGSDGFEYNQENFQLKHTRRGIVSMVNTGKNSNWSQFQICFA